AQSLAAPVRAHVHAMLDAVPVARPCAKLAEAAESHDARSVPRHDDRETKPHLGVEPCLAASRGEFLLGVNGRRMADDLVVDRQYLRQIAPGSVVDGGRHDGPRVSPGLPIAAVTAAPPP